MIVTEEEAEDDDDDDSSSLLLSIGIGVVDCCCWLNGLCTRMAEF